MYITYMYIHYILIVDAGICLMFSRHEGQHDPYGIYWLFFGRCKSFDKMC